MKIIGQSALKMEPFSQKNEPQSYKHICDDPSSLDFDSYWDMVQFNTQVTTWDLWVEGVRQWFVIFATIGLCYLFIHSIYNLRRT